MAEGTVVLLSGGVDSAVLLHRVARSGKTTPLFFDYGQRAAKQERAAARAQCTSLELELVCLDIASVGHTFAAEKQSKPHVPVPHRNLVLVSLALSYAASVEAAAVALSVIRDDVDWYASASLGFLEALRELARTLDAATIETPFVAHEKAAVIADGKGLGVNFAQTYSCMVGHDLHCGRCHQCLARRNALAHAGVVEAEDFYRRA